MKIKEEMATRIRKVLLKKLKDMGCWGKGHVCESNLPKGFPPTERCFVVDIAYELRKEGLMVM